MSGILVLVEHREKEIRDITFEMLQKAYELSLNQGWEVSALLLSQGNQDLEKGLRGWAHKVVTIKDNSFAHYDPDTYSTAIIDMIRELSPNLVFIGHTPWGMDLAPALAVSADLPIVTDCVDIVLQDGNPKAIRQIYTGKIFCKVSMLNSPTHLFTIRPGSFGPQGPFGLDTEFIIREPSSKLPLPKRIHKGFIDTAHGEVDISQAQFLISIGRGIGEEENIAVIKDLAARIGAQISCSRPIVDKNWLPKYHQVGTSGKTVRPKVYLALGISGAFQHVAGIKSAGAIIAVNKDKKAPIFRVAHYGIVEDLFKVVSALREKLD